MTFWAMLVLSIFAVAAAAGYVMSMAAANARTKAFADTAAKMRERYGK